MFVLNSSPLMQRVTKQRSISKARASITGEELTLIAFYDRIKFMASSSDSFSLSARFARALVLCLLLATVVGCNSCTTNTYTNPKDVIFPDSNVSYSASVQPLMALGCAFSGCHAYNTASPLDSYISILSGSAGMVIPLKPDESKLVQVIQGKLSHAYSLANTITDNHRKGIAVWVKEGAKNN